MGPTLTINLSSIIIKFVIHSGYLVFLSNLIFNVNMLLIFKTEMNLLYNHFYY